MDKRIFYYIAAVIFLLWIQFVIDTIKSHSPPENIYLLRAEHDKLNTQLRDNQVKILGIISALSDLETDPTLALSYKLTINQFLADIAHKIDSEPKETQRRVLVLLRDSVIDTPYKDRHKDFLQSLLYVIQDQQNALIKDISVISDHIAFLKSKQDLNGNRK